MGPDTTESRWLYHLRLAGVRYPWPYAPPSLLSDGFIHASYRAAVLESARLYFPRAAALEVLQIDPERLGVPIDVAATPRGPMPHIEGPIVETAVIRTLTLERFRSLRDGR